MTTIEKKDKTTKIIEKIINRRSDLRLGRGRERGEIEFLRVKNGLSRFPAKLRQIFYHLFHHKIVIISCLRVGIRIKARVPTRLQLITFFDS